MAAYEMAFILLFVLLASSSICFSEHIETDEKVDVEFYYESLCDGCIQMYTLDIYPMTKDLGPWLNIFTYPFGNAEFVDANKTKVSCQHGEEECYGNKLHACAIDLLKDSKEYLKFNACLIGKSSNDTAADKCGRTQGVDSESIKKCAKSQRGQDLLIEAGIATYKVRPKQNYTPYVLINKIEFILETGKLICQQFVNPPKVCKNY